MISADEGIQVDEFVMGCLRLKGTARSSDLVRCLHEQRQIASRLNHIFEFLQDKGHISRVTESGKVNAITQSVFMEKAVKDSRNAHRSPTKEGSVPTSSSSLKSYNSS